MINLSLNELKLFAKSRDIKDYKKIWKLFNKNTRQTKTKNKPFQKEKQKRPKKILAN